MSTVYFFNRRVFSGLCAPFLRRLSSGGSPETGRRLSAVPARAPRRGRAPGPALPAHRQHGGQFTLVPDSTSVPVQRLNSPHASKNGAEQSSSPSKQLAGKARRRLRQVRFQDEVCLVLWPDASVKRQGFPAAASRVRHLIMDGATTGESLIVGCVADLDGQQGHG